MSDQSLPERACGSTLCIPLKRVYFEEFASGKKREEYRPYGPRWNEKTCYIGRRVVLSLGHGKQRRLTRTITSFDRSGVHRYHARWAEPHIRKGFDFTANRCGHPF